MHSLGESVVGLISVGRVVTGEFVVTKRVEFDPLTLPIPAKATTVYLVLALKLKNVYWLLLVLADIIIPPPSFSSIV